MQGVSAAACVSWAWRQSWVPGTLGACLLWPTSTSTVCWLLGFKCLIPISSLNQACWNSLLGRSPEPSFSGLQSLLISTQVSPSHTNRFPPFSSPLLLLCVSVYAEWVFAAVAVWGIKEAFRGNESAVFSCSSKLSWIFHFKVGDNLSWLCSHFWKQVYLGVVCKAVWQ